MKGPLVRASLEGRKTQTRRPIKCGCNDLHKDGNPVKLLGDWSLSVPPHQYNGGNLYAWRGKRPELGDWIETVQTDVDDCLTSRVLCPLGKAGDRLWVRETWGIGARPCPVEGGREGIEYRADEGFLEDDISLLPLYSVDPPDGHTLDEYCKRGWRPSIHMPRWACRLVLPLVSVRVERVQSITEEDAIAEGVPHNSDRPIDKMWCDTCLGHGVVERYAMGAVRVDDCTECDTARKLFRNIWVRLYGQESWDENPWVWVAEWKDIEVRT